MPKKIVSDPTQDETPQPTKKERINEPVTEFKAKLNKWGFIHVPKRTAPSLPFKIENPLMARIEDETLVIATTTKNQPKKAKARRKPKVVNNQCTTVTPFFSFWRTSCAFYASSTSTN